MKYWIKLHLNVKLETKNNCNDRCLAVRESLFFPCFSLFISSNTISCLQVYSVLHEFSSLSSPPWSTGALTVCSWLESEWHLLSESCTLISTLWPTSVVVINVLSIYLTPIVRCRPVGRNSGHHVVHAVYLLYWLKSSGLSLY